jgi:glycine dehydrogenase subunit 1
LVEKSVLGGVPVSRLMPDTGMNDVLLVAATEANTEEDLAIYETALRDVLNGVSA